jgi:hypothetical protein
VLLGGLVRQGRRSGSQSGLGSSPRQFGADRPLGASCAHPADVGGRPQEGGAVDWKGCYKAKHHAPSSLGLGLTLLDSPERRRRNHTPHTRPLNAHSGCAGGRRTAGRATAGCCCMRQPHEAQQPQARSGALVTEQWCMSGSTTATCCDTPCCTKWGACGTITTACFNIALLPDSPAINRRHAAALGRAAPSQGTAATVQAWTTRPLLH